MLYLSEEQEEKEKIDEYIYKSNKSFKVTRPKTALKTAGSRIEARCLNKGHVMEYISVEQWGK